MIPCESDFIPWTISSLNSILRTLIYFECFNNLDSGFPTSDFRKFLAKLNYSIFVELLMIGIAPSLLSSFSDTLRTLRVSFWLKATPIHSPPSGPKSLSLMDKLQSDLLRIKSAAMQTAPCIPREFLRIEDSMTPKSRALIEVFPISSSRMSSRPSPLIMFEAILS